MHARTLLPALVALAIFAPTSFASHGHTFTYVAAGGDLVVLDCEAGITGMVIGGACVSALGDTSITVTAYDATNLVIGMYVSFRDAAGLESNEIGSAVVCGSGTVAVPAGTVSVSVFLDQALGIPDCGMGAGPATTGTLDIAFG